MTVRSALLFVPLFALALSPAVAAAPAGPGAPSRKAEKGCLWKQRTDVSLGLQTWVQACDFGFRKVDFVVKGNSLAQRFSDGGEAEPVIDVFKLEGDETPEAGLKRLFASVTDKAVAARCVLVTFHGEGIKTPSGAKRYTFEPDGAFAKELAKTQDPGDIPEPPCGDYGISYDSIQYFETQPASGARRFVFVRAGQDDPLFDEATLKLLPPAP